MLGEIKRLKKFASHYEDEQKEISERIKALRAEMDNPPSKTVTANGYSTSPFIITV